MKSLLSILTSFLLLTSFGCSTLGESGSGRVVSENRVLDTFDEISLESSFHVFITQGTNYQCRMEAEDNLIPLLNVEVKRGTLVLETKDPIRPTKPINIYLTVKDLTGIEVSGSGNITGQTLIRSSKLEIEIAGSGDVKLQTEANFIKSTIAGSGTIELSGLAESHKIEITGSGKLLCTGLKTLRSSVEITGSGTCKVDATDVLDINITGSGDVFYASEPTKLNQKITGSGTLKKI